MTFQRPADYMAEYASHERVVLTHDTYATRDPEGVITMHIRLSAVQTLRLYEEVERIGLMFSRP